MLRNEFTVLIDRPVDEDFAFVTDLPRTPEWRTTVRQADALEWQGGSAVGTRFQAVTRVAGRRWNWVLEVTTWDPPWHFDYAVVEGASQCRLGTAARFTAWAADSRWWARSKSSKASGGLLSHDRLGMRRELRAHLANLKRILEN